MGIFPESPFAQDHQRGVHNDAGEPSGERSTAVGSEPAAAVAGGAEGETILGADAPALGTFTRGIFAAGMAGPRTTWNRPREASSL